jgi:hypothetical protein
MIEGRVVGSWRRVVSSSGVRVGVDFWTTVTSAGRRAVEQAADRYGQFLGTSVAVARS